MVDSWMVRAGRGSRYIENFRDDRIVAIGWSAVGDPKGIESRRNMAERMRVAFPDYTDQMAMVAAGQVFRFFNEIKVGDGIVTYDGRARSYLCGTILGEAIHDPSQEIESLTNRREVRWEKEKLRDDLSQAAQNSLGAILTLFHLNSSVASELWGDAKGSIEFVENVHPEKESPQTENNERYMAASLALATYEQVAEQAAEKIKDRIASLAWDQMQELVAGILRATGYVTEVSSPGSDRGRDIIASPDGFGFKQPRIVVEVKHRPRERIGAPELRAFIGGRRPHENGLYISTGGFTREAYYEAERASIPLKLLDFEELVASVLENYSKFDERTKQLLPLLSVYWPL